MCKYINYIFKAYGILNILVIIRTIKKYKEIFF